MPIDSKIQIRKGSSSQWNDVNPVLASGEPAYDSTNNILKVGDGTNNYLNLPILFSEIYASGIHNHVSSDVTDFNSSVSGLLPVTNILGGSNISVTPSGSIYTVSVSGSLGLTTEEVDDRVSNLLVAGSGISLDYNDGADTLTISVSGITSSEPIGSMLYLWANFR